MAIALSMDVFTYESETSEAHLTFQLISQDSVLSGYPSDLGRPLRN